ncbi:MAG: fibronectin type III domain-containing protein [Acidobacteriota bacterium]|jgi:hypothetical protein
MRIVLPTVPLHRIVPLLAILVLAASAVPAWGQQTTAVTITWDPSLDPDITAFRVYFAEQGTGALPLLMEVPSNETSVQVTGLTPGTSYCAEITSLRGSCESERSAQVCATPTNTGPTIIPLTPTGGDQCASRAEPLTVQLDDADDTIDPASIQVLINGVAVTPSVSGSGGSLTLTVALPATPPVDGRLTIDVTAWDTASPPNSSSLTYEVRLQPAPPTGLQVN